MEEKEILRYKEEIKRLRGLLVNAANTLDNMGNEWAASNIWIALGGKE